jgi:hypothetical protein
LGKVPTGRELKIYGKQDKDFPALPTINKRFASHADLLAALAEWVQQMSEFADIAAMLTNKVGASEPGPKDHGAEGFVYLLRSGAHYKIGSSEELEPPSKKHPTQIT